MKKISILIYSALITLTISAQKPFTIKGKLTDVDKPIKLMLNYHNGEKYVVDSTISVNGKFTFKGKILYPWVASIELKPLKGNDGEMTIEQMLSRDIQNFYLDYGKTTLNGNNKIKTALIKGGRTQQEYANLLNELKPLEDELQAVLVIFRKALKENNKEEQKKLTPVIREIRGRMSNKEEAFIKSNADSYVSLGLLDRRSIIIDPVSFDPLYNSLSVRMKTTKRAIEMGERLTIAKKTAIGKPAIDFTQNNTEGNPISLSSLKGKYVFLDFWASWCGPCREENPNVVKAYEKFKDKNFEIIAVSLDDKKEPWIEAIKKDGLPWIHVSDLKGWKNDVAKEYGVSAVPFNLLLDPNGVIIAKNLRGEDLDKKLEEFIK